MVDDTPYPQGRGSLDNPLTSADLHAEIQRVAADQQWDNAPGDPTKNIPPHCTYHPGTKGGFCGSHNWFRQSGVTYIYSVIADLPVACQKVERGFTDDSAPNSDARGDIAVNVTSHELFESLTAPYFNAWAASDTQEIGDKCASSFGAIADGGDVVLNGDSYILQSEWSNSAGHCVIG